MHNYGSNSNFSAIKNLKLKDLGPLSGNGMLSDYQLFKRAPNADTAAWTLSATASSIVQTNPSVAVFENTGVQSESQWLLTLSPKDTILVSTRPIIKESSELRCWVFPNPVIGSSVWELNTNLPEEFRFQLMDSQGRRLKDLRFRQKGICYTTDLTLSYLFNALPMFHRLGRSAYKKDLTNVRKLCSALGNPENNFRTLHIAGTNGKGSVSHLLAAVFQEHGYKTG